MARSWIGRLQYSETQDSNEFCDPAVTDGQTSRFYLLQRWGTLYERCSHG